MDANLTSQLNLAEDARARGIHCTLVNPFTVLSARESQLFDCRCSRE